MSGKPQILFTFVSRLQLCQDKLSEICDINVGIETEPDTRFLSEKQLAEHIPGQDAIIVAPLHKVNKQLLDIAGPRLKLVVCSSAGYEHVDLEECKKRGIIVCHCKGVIGKAVANLALALLLSITRGIVPFNEYVKRGNWVERGMFATTNAQNDILNSVVGIVGLGEIGFELLKRLLAFQVSRVLYCGNTRKPPAEDLGAQFTSFTELLRESDTVVICCALNDNTRNLMDSEAFATMKPNSVFINVSRGAIVDHDALYQALSSGHLKGAGLDVTNPEPFPSDHPLCKMPNCLILPHVGGFCEPTISLVLEMCCQQVEAHIRGTEVVNRLT